MVNPLICFLYLILPFEKERAKLSIAISVAFGHITIQIVVLIGVGVETLSQKKCYISTNKDQNLTHDGTIT